MVVAPGSEPAPVPPEPGPPEPGLPAPAPVLPAPVERAPVPGTAPRPLPGPAPIRPAPGPRPSPGPAPVALQIQKVRFESSPAGASIEVAGATHTTPFEIDLGPGDHRWAAQQKNRKPLEGHVVIDSPTAEVRVESVKLEPEVHKNCVVTPENNVAEARFAGLELYPPQTTDLPIGTWTVAVVLASGDKATGRIEVPPASAPGRCVLTVQVGNVQVQDAPSP